MAVYMDKLNVCDVLDSNFVFMVYPGASKCQYVTLVSFLIVFLVREFTEAAQNDRCISQNIVGNSGDE